MRYPRIHAFVIVSKKYTPSKGASYASVKGHFNLKMDTDETSAASGMP
jgi:hypothetical protein